MQNNGFWIILILVETFTLFCLGIIGNQIASLFQLPTYLLLIFAVFGLSLTVVISSQLRKPNNDEVKKENNLSLSRSRTQKEKQLPIEGYQYYQDKQEHIGLWNFNWAFLWGFLASILRLPFYNFGISYLWYVLLGIFILLSYFPLFQLRKRFFKVGSSSSLYEFILILTLITVIMSIGLILGFIMVYFGKTIRIHSY